jgi:NTE family protein
MPNTSFDRCAYAVFKGGGVAGMAHVGALKELENIFQFVGYAGTSAGSIVAFLAAAGLTAQELENALKRLDLKSVVGIYRHVIWLVPWILLLGWFSFIAWPVVWLISRQHVPPLLGWTLAVVSLAAAALVSYLSISLGVVPKKRLRDFLVREVKAKLPEFDRHTTFKQFREAGAKPLKVYASDLAGKAGQPFGEKLDDDRVPVVEAVITSAAFPLFFLPGYLSGRCMTDGGVACNLPVFLFDQELGQRRLPVVAFDLCWKDHPKEGKLWIIEFLLRLIVTAMQSHDLILENLTTRVVRVKISVPENIDVLNFSLSDLQKGKLFEVGANAARSFRKLESVRPLLPDDGAQTERQYVQAQHSPERLIVPLLRAFCEEAQKELRVENPRACIFIAFSDSIRRIAYHTFAENDPDLDIQLTSGEGITGSAWETGRFAFGVLPGQGLNDPLKAASVRADRRSAFCVPLFRVDVAGQEDLLRRPPFGVLVLDSSSTIDDLEWAEDPTAVMKIGKRWADTFAKLLY